MTVISDFVQAATRLPAPPGLVVKLIKLVNDPDTELVQIVSLFQTNPALSARLLKLANSVFYGLRGEVNTVQRATVLLGFKTIRSLAVTVWTHSLATQFQDEELQDLLSVLFLHSAGCAVVGQEIANKIAPDYRDDVFLAGLLHDIGRLALLCEKSSEYAALIKNLSLGPRESLVAEEIKVFGFSHVELGSYLAKSWGFPAFLVESSALHHKSGMRLVEQPVPYIVYMANLIANTHFANIGNEKIQNTDSSELGAFFGILGLNEPRQVADFIQINEANLQDMIGSMG